jgi:hypothetical protein
MSVLQILRSSSISIITPILRTHPFFHHRPYDILSIESVVKLKNCLLLRTGLIWVNTQRVLEIPYWRCVFCSWLVTMGQVGCPVTSKRNCYYSLRNNPEERSSHLLRGGSLTSYIVSFCLKGTRLKLGLFMPSVKASKLTLLGLFGGQQPPVGHDLLIHEVSRSHTTTHHSR